MKRILIIVLFAIVSLSAQATIWTVDSTNNAGYGSLRAAVDSASNGDTIRFNPNLIASGSDSIVLDSSIVFSKALTFKGLYTTSDTLFISGGGNDRVFTIDSTSNVTLDSMVIVDGYAYQQFLYLNGGAVSFTESDSLFVYHSIFKNDSCTVGSGGAIFVFSAYAPTALIVLNSIFSNNSSNNGGAIYNGSNFTNYLHYTKISHCLLSDNEGAAIVAYGDLILVSDTISNNSHTGYGGGINWGGNDTTSLTINNSIISNNSCIYGGGGGIYCGSNSPSTVSITNSTISFNSAQYGGGGLNLYGPIFLTITNSYLSNNGGGGVHSLSTSYSTMIIDNCSITNNSSGGGGGILADASDSVYVKILSSIISNNSGTNQGGGVWTKTDAISIIEVDSSQINFNNSGYGGGIFASGPYTSSSSGIPAFSSITVNNSSINNNNGGIYGGGILNRTYNETDTLPAVCMVTINNTTIRNNSAGEGGGIYNYCFFNGQSTATINLNRSTIEGNSAASRGAGIYNQAQAKIASNQPSFATVNVQTSTISDNILSTTYPGNQGAGIFNGGFGKYPTLHTVIENSTITGNLEGTEGSGIYHFFYPPPVVVTALSTIDVTGSIVSNGLFNFANDTTPVITSGGYNLFSDTLLVDAILTDQINVTDAMLNLDTLALNGGSTPTKVPKYPSLALNTGNPLDGSDAQNGPIIGIREIGAAQTCISGSIDYQNNCDSITWMDGNTYYASNNSAEVYFINSLGCDSIVVLHLSIDTTSSIDTLFGCDSLTWIDGITYYTSNNSATDTLVNSMGCDSVVLLNLTMNYTTYFTDTLYTCDSLTWMNGTTYYANNTTDSDTLVNSLGCDSIVTLNLTVNYTQNTTDTIIACDSLIWVNGITYYSDNTTAIDTLINAMGCDSIVLLNLTVLNNTFAIDTIQTCDSVTWIDGVTYYSNNTTATHALMNSIGCDSIVTLNLTVLYSTFSTDSYVVCDSLTWIDGITYHSSNNSATYTYVNSVGCDSIVTLDLTISNLNSNFTYVNLGSANFSFTNSSTGNFTNSHWAFGDGSTSTSLSTAHHYSNIGTYVVVLAIYDSNVVGDSCISYFTDTIIVTGASNTTQCNAGWVVYADSSSGGVTVVNSSTGTNLTYHWDFGDGDTSNLQFPSHTYASNGPFNLCLTIDDGNGCSDSYCDSITSNGVLFKNGFDLNVVGNYPLGIQNLGKEEEVKIYPNPTSTTLTIETQNFKITKIQIRDNSGKVVKTITSNFDIVNVESLATGVYHMELIGESETVTKKFIKQ